MLAMETVIRVARIFTKAKVAVAKVMRVVAPMTGIDNGGGPMPSMSQESESIPNVVCLLRVVRCLNLLEDYIPLEIKEEA